MARKAQRQWTTVSQLAGRITFSISAGKDANDPKYIPETKGFEVEITYDNELDMKYHALCDSVVAVQKTVKTYYWANKRFPFQPGKVQRVRGDGTFDVPVTFHMDKLEAQHKAGQLSVADQIRLIESFGGIVPSELRAQFMATPLVTAADINSGLSGSEGNAAELLYDSDWLRKQTTQKLKVLAQDNEIEGYDELTRDELIEKLEVLETSNDEE